MSMMKSLQNNPGDVHQRASAAAIHEMASLLERGFGVRFTILDARGEVAFAAQQQPACDWSRFSPLADEISRRGRAEFVADEDPFLVLALPWTDAAEDSYLAMAVFITRAVGVNENLGAAAAALGLAERDARAWAERQTPWPPSALHRISELTQTEWSARQRIHKLEAETQSLSDHLATTYEEISLLHRLTHNLKLSRSDVDLGRVALEWLVEVLPAQTLAIWFLPVTDQPATIGNPARTAPLLLASEHCPLVEQQFAALVEHLGREVTHQPLVINRTITDQPEWPFAEIRQLIAVPLMESQNVFGWLLAINHLHDGQFGTVEASLLGSVGAILGIHSGNFELYRQQSELLAGVVRALTSAIDAKDPYTCGHSDRVARIAVRLAEEMGWPDKSLQTIYMSGLLHDIGKIGINDAVLRKPGKLTEAEYEHIKRHVEIGHKILVDLKKLDDVLPVVLHHHESWDGQGYPAHLAGEEIPRAARIVSVADSYDAMGSDRPYRRGMPEEQIEGIFLAGAGKQWDPEVVAAFFRARNDLHEIVRRTDPSGAEPAADAAQ